MQFHISDMLTVITGRLVSRDGVDGLYRILNYMTGEDLYTHQLPRAAKECAPVLKMQFPHLADAESRWAGANTSEACAAWVAQFGPEYLEVQPLVIKTKRDPLAEAVATVGVERVIVFRPDDPMNERN